MKNILKQVLKNKVNQLEENYHFNLNDYSFIYNDRKAFIKDLSQSLQLVNPFLHYRNELNSFITTNELDGGTFDGADQFHKYLHKCMAIIGNMLDHEKMGSVEHYLDHIWKEFDAAINEENESMEPMQKFINHISNIITMIDYVVETQLASMKDVDIRSLMVEGIVNQIDPNAEVTGVTDVIGNGSIIKVDTKRTQCKTPNSIDLRKIKPLNTKEI